jgi:hypothetical protein
VPEGGYFTISNNSSLTVGAKLFNSFDLVLSGGKIILDILISGDSDFDSLIDGVMDEIMNDPVLYNLFVDWVWDAAFNTTTTVMEASVGAIAEAMTVNAADFYKSLGLSWRGTAGLGESIFRAFAGPAGIALKIGFSFNTYGDYIAQTKHVLESFDAPYVTIFTPTTAAGLRTHLPQTGADGHGGAIGNIINQYRIAAGYMHSFAIKNDGTLWAWGANDLGQLGDGTTINRRAPVKVMEGAVAISTSTGFAMALKTDGSLWAWGGNFSGQLGDGTTTQ